MEKDIEMREDMDNKFDLLIKETLSDAEVKVPSRVWKAVSARIGATTPFAGVWTSLWKWAVPSFAFAAIALLLIVSGAGEKTIIDRGSRALRVEAGSCVFEQGLCAADIPAIRNLSGSRTEVQVLSAQSADPFAAPVIESEQPAGQETSADSRVEPVREQSDFADPFALMEAEDARTAALQAGKRKGRTSFVVGATVGTNDTHYTNSSFGPSFASGSRVPDAVEENTASDFAFPVSFGLSVKYRLTDRLSLGTGLNWTMLSREFDGSYKTETGRFTHKMQYVGIPVHIYYDILQRRGLQLYLTAGGSAEKAVCNSWYIYDKSTSPIYTEKVNGLQYGVDLGFGVEFSLGRHLSVYLDPYVKYWFAGSQPKSIRTEKPILFSFEGGLRFNL